MSRRKKTTPEGAVLDECMLAATKMGARLWRNNVGLFYTKDGRLVRCGLCKDSPDLVGITAQGRFLVVEGKRPDGGRVTLGQLQFLELIRDMGGVAVLARSGDDVTKALQDEATWLIRIQ